ncbi:MAG: electron transport complex subunit RsxG [Hydrogenophilales bacterium CG03_land_8_20_14_0_80_62_28]|nr:electron transport complex subunit RsxG [Betaproteobacteria bacterium]OIO78932.1 MAG: electron transporter RnfG [Hydrogenophilaceae bacterium CG1_02_62_390]PIV24071.1 MAG: electron transport complex subunit RsxG [Hydrogenophilales bacterium CG03_land_8_20_14_0_80_62_28]PIW37534.1 MAG: electron transport complex subunit RsxG [Hydrogenophilales bacterium CG15_BIG_FIL_POST_REV_8_21_14_020_62_31]PIW70985.1 MAG: electron transport complex subunit RsxG [Hydrogenophilales bacterium CG12_big_fil_rev
MNEYLRNVKLTALALLGFAVVAAVLLAGTFGLTRPSIEKSERDAKIKLIAQVLPAGGYDNDLVKTARSLPADPLLGLKKPGEYYPATLAGKPAAVVLEAIAPDGYAGEIKLLVGILPDGRLTGVRVTAHSETPGLGDYIDIAKNPWIRQFAGKSLDSPKPDDWRVKKDGGKFDSMAGATISPRAVVKAVKQALDYFARHQTELLVQEEIHGQ